MRERYLTRLLQDDADRGLRYLRTEHEQIWRGLATQLFRASDFWLRRGIPEDILTQATRPTTGLPLRNRIKSFFARRLAIVEVANGLVTVEITSNERRLAR